MLEVGQTVAVDVELAVAGVRETVDVAARAPPASTPRARSSTPSFRPRAIEALPLNGRNFLELALLVPGNAPAPNFDPTKSNSVVISSAGQLGRGGNITIDGADNNDDVVGGPLQNVTQESVQEFQIATNRFTAESGRSASSVINVVTKSGTDQLRGSVVALRARQRVAGAAGDLRPVVAATRCRSIASSWRARRAVRWSSGKAFWFGAAEYRNQDGAVLVGARDVAARTIRADVRAGAARRPARLGPRWTGVPNGADALVLRYAGERATDTGASSLDRAIGSASQRQRSRNSYHSVVGTLDARRQPDAAQRRDRLVQHLRQRDRAGRGAARS